MKINWEIIALFWRDIVTLATAMEMESCKAETGLEIESV